jgi:hypothetical protein
MEYVKIFFSSGECRQEKGVLVSSPQRAVMGIVNFEFIMREF